jgi:hypothetical protein
VSACSVSRSRPSLARIIGLLAVFATLGLVWGASCAVSAKQEKKAEAVTCATCHAGVANSYLHAPMRHAMEPAEANPMLLQHTSLTTQLNGYTYSLQTREGKTTYTVSDASGSVSFPIHWVLGQHSQTYLLEKDGSFYETLVTYFPRDNVLAVTPGDQDLRPKSLHEAMGRKLSNWEVLGCFDCHSSGAVSGTHLNLDKIKLGIDCEHCHAGAQQHMADAVDDNFKTIPKSLKRMSTGDISNFCGQCHRTWETTVRNHWRGPAFVRFQPYRLQNSKCFAADDSRISCLACHNPHEPLNHDQAFYDKKCLACHAQMKVVSASHPSTTLPVAKTCPVAKDNCSTCHMPKVEIGGNHARFTDHQIRIVRPGESYPD